MKMEKYANMPALSLMFYLNIKVKVFLNQILELILWFISRGNFILKGILFIKTPSCKTVYLFLSLEQFILYNERKPW